VGHGARPRLKQGAPPRPPPLHMKNIFLQNESIENTKPRTQIWKH